MVGKITTCLLKMPKNSKKKDLQQLMGFEKKAL
jgi:hypothetical protein